LHGAFLTQTRRLGHYRQPESGHGHGRRSSSLSQPQRLVFTSSMGAHYAKGRASRSGGGATLSSCSSPLADGNHALVLADETTTAAAAEIGGGGQCRCHRKAAAVAVAVSTLSQTFDR